jgi:5-methyltetrahydropteroyltriglutamate--homocysteine methyltransferase
MTVDDFRRWLEVRVEALNVALRGIPPDRVRLHVCWGSPHFPHKNDVPLEAIADIILRANVQTFSFEASNPRHDHDWAVWETRLPEGKMLMPGVVGHYTDMIEHPGLVAERHLKYASVVGRENVIGGTDCGLGSRVGTAEICWAKLETLAEGARLASAKAFAAGAPR